MGALTKITILEDDPTIRRIYRMIFAKSGFDVRAYADAESVVEKVSAFRPDVVLTDLIMPKIDGYETIRRLQANPKTRRVPIVVISNLGDSVSQQKSAYLGAIDFLVKSNYAPSALVLRIRDVLAGKTPKLAVDPKVVAFFKAEERAQAEHAQLSPEERQYA